MVLLFIDAGNQIFHWFKTYACIERGFTVFVWFMSSVHYCLERKKCTISCLVNGSWVAKLDEKMKVDLI